MNKKFAEFVDKYGNDGVLASLTLRKQLMELATIEFGLTEGQAKICLEYSYAARGNSVPVVNNMERHCQFAKEIISDEWRNNIRRKNNQKCLTYNSLEVGISENEYRNLLEIRNEFFKL
jgi:hypothetical protein